MLPKPTPLTHIVENLTSFVNQTRQRDRSLHVASRLAKLTSAFFATFNNFFRKKITDSNSPYAATTVYFGPVYFILFIARHSAFGDLRWRRVYSRCSEREKSAFSSLAALRRRLAVKADSERESGLQQNLLCLIFNKVCGDGRRARRQKSASLEISKCAASETSFSFEAHGFERPTQLCIFLCIFVYTFLYIGVHL